MAVPTDQQILDALRTALYEIATNGTESYMVNGRNWTALNLPALEKAISVYETRVNRRTRRMMSVGVFQTPR